MSLQTPQKEIQWMYIGRSGRLGYWSLRLVHCSEDSFQVIRVQNVSS